MHIFFISTKHSLKSINRITFFSKTSNTNKNKVFHFKYKKMIFNRNKNLIIYDGEKRRNLRKVNNPFLYTTSVCINKYSMFENVHTFILTASDGNHPFTAFVFFLLDGHIYLPLLQFIFYVSKCFVFDRVYFK
jgi:hypothetical protein